MSILKDFYNGNLIPCDEPMSRKYNAKLKEVADFEDRIKRKLKDQKKASKLMFDFSLCTAGLNSITAEENYMNGFETGVRLMVEILGVLV